MDKCAHPGFHVVFTPERSVPSPATKHLASQMSTAAVGIARLKGLVLIQAPPDTPQALISGKAAGTRPAAGG